MDSACEVLSAVPGIKQTINSQALCLVISDYHSEFNAIRLSCAPCTRHPAKSGNKNAAGESDSGQLTTTIPRQEFRGKAAHLARGAEGRGLGVSTKGVTFEMGVSQDMKEQHSRDTTGGKALV